MMQKRTVATKSYGAQVVLLHYVKFPNLQIAACNPFHQIGTDVAGNDMPSGSDALRKPL